MSSKQLSIVVKAVDQATGPLRNIATATAAVVVNIAQAQEKAAKSTGGLASRLTSLKALIIEAGVALLAWRGFESLNNAAETVEKVGQAAKRLGDTVENMSALRYIAEQSHKDFDTLAGGISKLQKNAAEFARTGGGKAADAFRRLGVPVADAEGHVRKIGELMPDLLAQIQAVGDEAEQNNLAEALFGRGKGSAFLDIMREAPHLLDDFAIKAEQARRMGVIFNDHDYEIAVRYQQAINNISQAWTGLRVRVLGAVGPLLETLANRMASLVAAVPKIVSNVAEKLREALGGDGQAAVTLFESMGTQLLRITQAVTQGVARIAVAGTSLLVNAVMRLLNAGLDTFMEHLPMRIGLALSKVINEASLAFNNWGADLIRPFSFRAAQLASDEGARVYKERMDALKTEAEHTNREMSIAMSKMGQLTTSDIFNTDDWGKVKQAFSESKNAVLENAYAMWSSIDDVLGFSKALADTSLEGIKLADVMKNSPPAPNDEHVTQWKAFLNGVGSGFENLKKNIAGTNGTMDLGRSVADQFSESLSGGLAQATVESIGHMQNFGKAVRSVMADVSKQVAEAILKFMLLRAITNIGTSLFSGGAGGAPAVTPGAGSVPLVGDLSSIGMARGGWIHAAGGTWVSGPNVARDIVPAMLMPGERVLSRGEVGNMGGISAVDRAARGGGGGGNTFNFNAVINMQAGASGPALKAALNQWWNDKVANSPAFRESLA